MAKKKAPKKKSKPRKRTTSKTPTRQPLSEATKTKIAGGILLLSAIFALLLFNARVSLAGDDSTTIYTALRFLKLGTYPSFHGPLYPLVLSAFISVIGLKVVFLKFLSFLFVMASFSLFYLCYRNELPFAPMALVLAIIGWNSYLLYYASMSFAEGFFMFVQMGVVYYFYRNFDQLSATTTDKDSLIKWAGLGLIIFLTSLTRNAGIACLFTFMLFWLLYLNWRALGFTVLAYLLFRLPYELGMTAAGIKQQFSGQGRTFLYKDPYNFDAGREDFMGYINRFGTNVDLYISKHTPKIFGLRPEDTRDTSTLVSILIIVLAISALVYLYKRNQKLVFALVLFAAYAGLSFVVLQARWDQDRLILPYLPYLLVGLVGAGSLWSQRHNKSIPKWGLLLILGGLLVPILARTLTKAGANSTTLRKNLSGDLYYGFDDDYRHYMMMSKWVAENLSEDEVAACRKASISGISSGGKIFYGLTRLPSQDADDLLERLKSRNVTHIMAAALRLNPKVKNGQIITTVHNWMTVIERKYRGTFRLVHQIGDDDSEPCKLYSINYPQSSEEN